MLRMLKKEKHLLCKFLARTASVDQRWLTWSLNHSPENSGSCFIWIWLQKLLPSFRKQFSKKGREWNNLKKSFTDIFQEVETASLNSNTQEPSSFIPVLISWKSSRKILVYSHIVPKVLWILTASNVISSNICFETNNGEKNQSQLNDPCTQGPTLPPYQRCHYNFCLLTTSPQSIANV